MLWKFKVRGKLHSKRIMKVDLTLKHLSWRLVGGDQLVMSTLEGVGW